MVIFAFLFWLALGWGLHDTDIYFKEAAVFAVLWIIAAAVFILVPAAMIPSIVALLLINVVLLYRVFGQDIQLR